MFSIGFGLLGSKTVHAANFVVTNTNDSGPGSLRDAITQANSTTATDTIGFAIGSGGHVQIIPTSPLPPITQPIIIDGTFATGFSGTPIIEISGNGAGANARGLYITGSASGSIIKDLIINRFSAQGIFVDTSNVTITGNYIGTDASGTTGAGNSGDGVAIFSGTSLASANNNTIGGTTASTRNIISGNGGNGIGITAQDGGSASNNTIAGNYVGTDSSGTSVIGNVGDGILLNNAQGIGTMTNNTIGGSTGTTPGGACTGTCNLVSGNGANGIGLWHGGVTSSIVIGNYVGVNVNGASALGNGNIGIELNESANNTVGGTTPAERNVFSGNGGAGVFVTGSGGTGNVIRGNYIGTNASGTSGVGNLKMGIGMGSSPNATQPRGTIVGGNSLTTPGISCSGPCNLISGNKQNGIFISGMNSNDAHQILGNYIGLNAAGDAAIGNVGDGVGVLNGQYIFVGDGSNGGQNIIASNGSNGVVFAGGSTQDFIDRNIIGLAGFGNTASGVAVSSANRIAITENSIYGNGILGIDLDNNGSVSLNSPGGPHSGANHLQNYPDIYAVHTIGSSTKIGGEYNGIPNTTFQLEFYDSSGCNGGPPNNYGQGQNYLGSTTVRTDQFGNTTFGFTTASPVPGNTYVTATASTTNGSYSFPVQTADEASEFSKCVVVNASKPVLTNGATWFLKDYLITGGADKTFGYGFPSYLLLCAWDPNQPGVKLPVIFSGGTWYMRASYTTGTADNTFSFGPADGKPVCGDWNGDGVASPGVFKNGTWYLRNTSNAGPADLSFDYGGNFSGLIPLVGDWDGNGTDTVGVYSGGHFQLRNSNSNGSPDYDFVFNPPNIKNVVIGDWDGNGTETIGLVDTNNNWILRNSNSSGTIDAQFQYGFPGATPLTW